MYRVFEHTADLGLRIEAADLPTLFAEAGRGLFSIIVENLDEVRPTNAVTFAIPGDDRTYLFFDWLNELLYAFETKRLLFCQFEVHVTDQGLRATARGEPLDEQRHRTDHEVKAITYHALKVAQSNGGWVAEVIVDI